MRRIITVGAISLFLIALLSLSVPTSSFLKIRLTEVFIPVQRGIYAAFRGLGDFVHGIGGVIRAARLNQQLEEQNVFLTREIIRLREVEKENQGLRSLLAFKKESSYKSIAAQIVGRDIRNWYGSILIAKGKSDGVEKGAAVVSARGVIGKVIEVAPHISRVLLIVDRNSRVGGVLQSSRLSGIVEGLSSNLCVINYLPRRIKIDPGELVLTSGLGQIFPPGLPLGTINRVYPGKFGLHQYADLEPAADFDRLSQVMVMIKPDKLKHQ